MPIGKRRGASMVKQAKEAVYLNVEKSVIKSANEKVIQNYKAGTPLPCREKPEQEIQEAFHRASEKVFSLI